MTPENPKARRSQLLSTYGVGGLFPAENTSFMIRGLQDWSTDDRDDLVVSEPRLAQSLGVSELRLPPAGRNRDIPVVRFPETQVCPACHRIAHWSAFRCGWNESVCKLCPTKNKGGLAPFRLLVCCPRGHIDEFPYFRWLHQGQESASASHEMKLEAEGATSSLGDMRLSCSCSVQPTDLEGVFGIGALRGVTKCHGRRPWLGPEYAEDCNETPRTVQRGAANVWFPSVRSTISIPPYSEAVAKFVDQNWNILQNVEALNTDWAIAGVMLKARGRFTEADVRAETERRHRADASGEEPTEQSLRRDEFKALIQGREEATTGSDFVAETVEPPEDLSNLLTEVRKVSRLREVRALYGFSRLTPVQGPADAKERLCALAPDRPAWLPAIEVIGEGVFLNFSRQRLSAWAARDWVVARAATLQKAALRAALTYHRTPPPPADMVQVAVHTLAHVLIDQLSLDSGYPASSLRERLYVDEQMAGLLLYTASSDSAGSLGGVAAHADTKRLTHALKEGLDRLAWCSSDPVCIESSGSGTDGLNLAACHACVLVPETSCELNNTLLDRACLFGTPEDPDKGLFSAWQGSMFH